MSIVMANDLCKHYGSSENPVKALSHAQFSMAKGERVALVGRSGSGKTTMLNLLAGLDRPTSGVLRVAGKDLPTLSSRALAQYRCRDIGVVFQSFQLLPNRSALANVEVPLMLQGMDATTRRQRALAALDRVGLSERAAHQPAQMSGGEQQRVAVARAVVHRPSVILADEPTGNLDSQSAEAVMALILEVVKEVSAALLLITHDHALARVAATRLVTMSDGCVKPAQRYHVT